MANVVIWGTGLIAEVLHYYLTNDSPHAVVAFCVDEEHKEHDVFLNKPVIAFQDVEEKYSPGKYEMAIGLSYKHLNKIRESKYLQTKEKGYRCISYVHSSTRCDASAVGENTFILAQNDIQPFSTIGNNVTIWSGNSIGHHVTIGDNCFLSSTRVSGATRVGKNTFLGAGSTVAEKLRIGEYCIIGAGVTVTKDVESGAILAAKQPQAMPLKSWDIEELL